jgi:hypothetical protein
MGAVRKHEKPIFTLLLLVASVLCLSSCEAGFGEEASMSNLSGKGRANALVVRYSRHLGAGDRVLDASNDVSFGASGLFYDAQRDVLVGRALVTGAMLEGAPLAEVVNLRRMVSALNDPAIGGMFDQGGGSFILDEGKDNYYLVRAFPLATTTPNTLIADMERMEDIAVTWTVRWFSRVAMIMHGHQKPPSAPVNRDNDTQR